MLGDKLKILMYGEAMWAFGEGMLGPLFAVFAQKIGGDILSISTAWAAYLIVLGLLIIIFGKISDWMSKERMFLFGCLMNTLFTFGYLLVSRPFHLFLVQVGLGIGSALTIPTWFSLYSKYEERRKSGSQWGFGMGLSRITTGLAVIAGGLIVTFFSFKILFITMGIIHLLATVYQARILKVTEKVCWSAE